MFLLSRKVHSVLCRRHTTQRQASHTSFQCNQATDTLDRQPLPTAYILRELRSVTKITLLIARGTCGMKFQFAVWELSDRAFETLLSFWFTTSLYVVRPTVFDMFKEEKKVMCVY